MIVLEGVFLLTFWKWRDPFFPHLLVVKKGTMHMRADGMSRNSASAPLHQIIP